MEWTQFIIMFLGMIGLFAWNRAEARNDNRHMDNKMDQWRAETNLILEAIRQDMKDFHGRLERQDAEFKAHIMYFHENKGK